MARRSAASLYLWIWGAMLVVLGIAGLLVHPDFAVGDGVTDKHVWGVFETNGWHAVAGLGFGVLSLVVAAWAPERAPVTAFVVAVFGGVLPTAAFLLAGDGGVALGLIPVDLTDTVTLHLVPGVVGVACAVLSAEPGRRHSVASVATRRAT